MLLLLHLQMIEHSHFKGKGTSTAMQQKNQWPFALHSHSPYLEAAKSYGNMRLLHCLETCNARVHQDEPDGQMSDRQKKSIPLHKQKYLQDKQATSLQAGVKLAHKVSFADDAPLQIGPARYRQGCRLGIRSLKQGLTLACNAGWEMVWSWTLVSPNGRPAGPDA